ncbi:MAG: MarR family winged helix-turn-helix transcriptional regulator [Xanthobacteraceae bacterium]
MKASKETAETTSSSQVTGHGDPPWHAVPTAIARRLHQICVAKTSAVVTDAGLTPLQYGVLIHLSKLTGKPGIEQNNLADRLNVDRNTASLLVEQLVKKELVERRVNRADRRARILSLTPKGEKLYAQLRPAHLAANESILTPITSRERKLLISLLIRVIEGNFVRQGTASQGRGQRLRR